MFKGSTPKGPNEEVLEAARAARDEGRAIFVAKLLGGLREDAADQWGRTLEEVEALGWRLDRWAVSEHLAWPVFRRR